MGAPPTLADTGVDTVEKTGGLADLVVEADLPSGIRAHAFRDGMIVFALGPSGPTYEGDFMAWEYTLVRLMNAHLACLHSVLTEPGLIFSAVVTVWSSFQVDFQTGGFRGGSAGSSGGVAFELYRAREALSGTADWRLLRGPLIAIPTDGMRASFDLLRDLLDRPHKPDEAALLDRRPLFRAELLLRAKAALLDVDYTGALTNAWTASEGMLGDLMSRYLDDSDGRPAGHDASGNALKFMKPERRRFFESGEWTIRHTMEFLSLVDCLPFGLYREARECSKARNDWMHYETVPSNEVANMAIGLGGKLFELLEGIPLRVHGQPPE